MATWSDYERAKAYVFSRLEQDLAPTLFYHDLAHTRDDVLPAAIHLLVGEGVNQTDRLLVQTAVVYHDSGHLVQYDGHEAASMQIAAETLPEFGYDASEIAQICALIAATQLAHHPTTLLEELIKDADLDVLGREDFLAKNECLRKELRARGVTITVDAWNQSQLEFIQEHNYYTATARARRDKQKQQNIEAMQAILMGTPREGCN